MQAIATRRHPQIPEIKQKWQWGGLSPQANQPLLWLWKHSNHLEREEWDQKKNSRSHSDKNPQKLGKSTSRTGTGRMLEPFLVELAINMLHTLQQTSSTEIHNGRDVFAHTHRKIGLHFHYNKFVILITDRHWRRLHSSRNVCHYIFIHWLS